MNKIKTFWNKIISFRRRSSKVYTRLSDSAKIYAVQLGKTKEQSAINWLRGFLSVDEKEATRLYHEIVSNVDAICPVVESSDKTPIISNVPIPDKWTLYPRKYRSEYSLMKSLKIGESFFIEGTYTNIRINVYSRAKRLGIKVLTRGVEENGVKGFRIWRTS